MLSYTRPNYIQDNQDHNYPIDTNSCDGPPHIRLVAALFCQDKSYDACHESSRNDQTA